MTWAEFLDFVDKVGLPLALFAVTIIVVLLMQRSERKDTSDSIKVVNDITIANHSALTSLQRDYRILLIKYGKVVQTLTAAEKNLQIFNETYQNDKAEWERERGVMQTEIDQLKKELERVLQELTERNNEIKVLRKDA